MVGVVVGAKDVGPKASFAQVVGYRGDPNPLSYGALRTRPKRITPAVHLNSFVSITLGRLSISFTGQDYMLWKSTQ